MQQIPIQAIPNQNLVAILDGNTWNITIKSVEDAMAVSFIRNDIVIIENTRAVAGSMIIPSIYEEAGNFLFTTQNQQLPDYTQFNVTQSLVYVSAAELAIFRQPVAPPIKTTDFNPLAALPLRFAPQGYTS